MYEAKRVRQLIKIDELFLDSYLYLAQMEYDEENHEAYTRFVWEAYLKAGVIGQNVEVFAVFCVEVFTVKSGLRQQPQFDCINTAQQASFGVRRTCRGVA